MILIDCLYLIPCLLGAYVHILALEVFGVGSLRRENRDFWICSLQLEATLSNKREKTSVKEIEMSELMN